MALIQFDKNTANEQEFRKSLKDGSGFESLKNQAEHLYRKESKHSVANKIFDLVDSAAVNDIWRAKFQKSFNREAKSNVTFNVFDDKQREIMKEFTVTGGVSGTNIDGLFETTILPVVDGLLFDNSPILSRVSMIEAGFNTGNQSFDLNEFASERDAEDLDEDDEGTEADDKPRTGDTLTPNKKLQASTSFTEYALLTMDPTLIGQFMARLVRRVENRFVSNIFGGSNASNRFKGIINSFGSTEDDQEGSLLYTAPAGTDNIDKVLGLAGDLPNAVTNAEETNFAYYMTRATWYNKIRMVKDANANYKINNVITEIGGQRTLNGLPVIFVGYGLADNTVCLADLSNYYVARKGSIMFQTDEGIANMKAAKVIAVARAYADGGMVMAHKNAVSSGAGANDNRNRNMFRHVSLT